MEIGVIKLGADGDVLRTLPIASAIKNKYPKAKITWITRGDISEIVKLCKDVDNVEILPYRGKKEFDIAYNFDVDAEALKLMESIEAKKKFGFYGEGGYPAAYNFEGEYYLNTMFDDALKKSNKKTYQEIMFGAAELPYNKENLVLQLPKYVLEYAASFAKENGLQDKKIIGIHMGASKRWPSKAWHPLRVESFVEKASKKYSILLFGGPDEKEEHTSLSEKLTKKGVKVVRNNPSNTKIEFLALLSLCDIVICSDSFALHAALLLGKKTVVLFFCTSPEEVEGYGLLHKMIAKNLYEFFPEKSNIYDPMLTQSITEEEILEIVDRIAKQKE